jgi:hypothetical protein
MQCELLGVRIVSDDFKNMIFNKTVALVAFGEFTEEELHLLARVERRANFGRMGNQLSRTERDAILIGDFCDRIPRVTVRDTLIGVDCLVEFLTVDGVWFGNDGAAYRPLQ